MSRFLKIRASRSAVPRTGTSTIARPNCSYAEAIENINIDFPPTSVWTRVGVFYWSAHSNTFDLHPEVANRRFDLHGRIGHREDA
jgi:hypothetical protein